MSLNYRVDVDGKVYAQDVVIPGNALLSGGLVGYSATGGSDTALSALIVANTANILSISGQVSGGISLNLNTIVSGIETLSATALSGMTFVDGILTAIGSI